MRSRQRLLGDGMKYRALLAVRAVLRRDRMFDGEQEFVSRHHQPDLLNAFAAEEVTVCHSWSTRRAPIWFALACGAVFQGGGWFKSLEQLRTDAWWCWIWCGWRMLPFPDVDPAKVKALKDQLANETIKIQCEAFPPFIVPVLISWPPTPGRPGAAKWLRPGAGYDLQQEGGLLRPRGHPAVQAAETAAAWAGRGALRGAPQQLPGPVSLGSSSRARSTWKGSPARKGARDRARPSRRSSRRLLETEAGYTSQTRKRVRKRSADQSHRRQQHQVQQDQLSSGASWPGGSIRVRFCIVSERIVSNSCCVWQGEGVVLEYWHKQGTSTNESVSMARW